MERRFPRIGSGARWGVEASRPSAPHIEDKVTFEVVHHGFEVATAVQDPVGIIAGQWIVRLAAPVDCHDRRPVLVDPARRSTIRVSVLASK